MVDVLRDIPTKRHCRAGGDAEAARLVGALHRDVGNYVAAQGIDVLVGIRGA